MGFGFLFCPDPLSPISLALLVQRETTGRVVTGVKGSVYADVKATSRATAPSARDFASKNRLVVRHPPIRLGTGITYVGAFFCVTRNT